MKNKKEFTLQDVIDFVHYLHYHGIYYNITVEELYMITQEYLRMEKDKNLCIPLLKELDMLI